MSAAGEFVPTGTAGLVEYHSRGSLLIAGPAGRAAACSRRLSGALQCTLLVDGDPGTEDPGRARHCVRGRLAGVGGHLGAFRVHACLDGEPAAVDLGEKLGDDRAEFDLVLDLGPEPCVLRDVPPIGYFAPVDEVGLERAVKELPGMVGTFEKPRYFRYNPAICAHGESGLAGCKRCLDACAAEAIESAGDKIRVDPYLCQGCGACATACPTGAIGYAFPDSATLINDLRKRIAAERDRGSPVNVVFHDRAETAPASMDGVLPYRVEDLASVGMEVWLSALAFGASRVLLVAGPHLPANSRRELERQLEFARSIITALGIPEGSLVCVGARSPEQLSAILTESFADLALAPAAFAGLGNKREQLFFAIDHLYSAAGRPVSETTLPAGAPFGMVEVDRGACTLCMTCVGICPARALEAGGNRPLLSFIEADCVQCGLCKAACPEHAITLKPRLLFDRRARLASSTVNEEQPFSCIRCGKPFATVKMIDAMLGRLANHRMFQNDRALSRLKMCEDCRVLDVLADKDGLNVARAQAVRKYPGDNTGSLT